LQGQLNLLKNKTDLATVVVTLHERDKMTPLTSPNFSSEVARSFLDSWQSLVMFGKMLILIFVAVVPWLLPVFVLLAPLVIFRQLRRHPRQT
jgi:hypothetical protein